MICHRAPRAHLPISSVHPSQQLAHNLEDKQHDLLL